MELVCSVIQTSLATGAARPRAPERRHHLRSSAARVPPERSSASKLGHVVGGGCKVEDMRVLRDAVPIGRLRDHRDAALDAPAQEDLGSGSPRLACDSRNHRVAQLGARPAGGLFASIGRAWPCVASADLRRLCSWSRPPYSRDFVAGIGERHTLIRPLPVTGAGRLALNGQRRYQSSSSAAAGGGAGDESRRFGSWLGGG